MKLFLSISIILVSSQIVLGQASQQKTLAKFVITDASFNKADITPQYLENNAYVVFYTIENNDLNMANVMPKSSSQSYGRLYNGRDENLKETDSTYRADIFYFEWRYINTYDSKRGTATVKFVKIYKPQGITFSLTIIPENLDVLVLKGYMKGSLNLDNYLN